MGGNAKAYQWMAGLHAAPWSIGHVIENQGVRHNKKLVCVAILAGNPQVSEYKQYYIKNSAYCAAVHPVVASTPVKLYLKDKVNFLSKQRSGFSCSCSSPS